MGILCNIMYWMSLENELEIAFIPLKHLFIGVLGNLPPDYCGAQS